MNRLTSDKIETVTLIGPRDEIATLLQQLLGQLAGDTFFGGGVVVANNHEGKPPVTLGFDVDNTEPGVVVDFGPWPL